MLDRAGQLAPRAQRFSDAERGARARSLVDDGEDRDREQREERADEDEAQGRGVSVGVLGQPVQQPGEDGSHVAERHADTGEPSAGVAARDVGQDRVVVDQCGLVAEVGDREEDEAGPDAHQADQRRRHDAHHREDQQVGLAAAGPIAHGPEGRRDDGVEQDGYAGG